MKFRKVAFVTLVTLVVSHGLVVLAASGADLFVREVVASFLPLVLGLLLAAVGIFLGSLANLYGLVRDSELEQEERRAIAGRVSSVIEEVRQDTVFALAGLAATLILRLFSLIDVPFITWPFTSEHFAKAHFVNSISISICVMVFLAIYDCVSAMFTIHKGFDEIVVRGK